MVIPALPAWLKDAVMERPSMVQDSLLLDSVLETLRIGKLLFEVNKGALFPSSQRPSVSHHNFHYQQHSHSFPMLALRYPAKMYSTISLAALVGYAAAQQGYGAPAYGAPSYGESSSSSWSAPSYSNATTSASSSWTTSASASTTSSVVNNGTTTVTDVVSSFTTYCPEVCR